MRKAGALKKGKPRGKPFKPGHKFAWKKGQSGNPTGKNAGRKSKAWHERQAALKQNPSPKVKAKRRVVATQAQIPTAEDLATLKARQALELAHGTPKG